MAEKDGKFIRLRNVDNSFQERSNFVFAKLDDLTPKTKHEKREEKDKNIGSKPRRRLPKRVPDHVLSPEKWTKYSLKVKYYKSLSLSIHNPLQYHGEVGYLWYF